MGIEEHWDFTKFFWYKQSMDNMNWMCANWVFEQNALGYGMQLLDLHLKLSKTLLLQSLEDFCNR